MTPSFDCLEKRTFLSSFKFADNYEMDFDYAADEAPRFVDYGPSSSPSLPEHYPFPPTYDPAIGEPSGPSDYEVDNNIILD